MVRRLEAVLWDMDGTLLDSEPLWQAGRNQIAKRYDVEWTEDDHSRAVGKSLNESADRLRAKGVPLSIEDINDELVRGVISVVSSRVPWRPGALELLRAVRQSGTRNALVTQAFRPLAELVATASGVGVFAVVVAGDDVTKGKPDPEAYVTALKRLGVDSDSAVAIEDSPTGVASAIGAGLRVVAVPYLSDLSDSATGVQVVTTISDLTIGKLSSLLNTEVRL